MPQDADFDPYHEWLAIPRDQRPPTHYQLLGLSFGEQNAKVIEMAAVRQSAFIRSFQSGAHGEFANKLLNEVSEARTTLSDPARRRHYQAQMEAQMKSAPKPAPSNSRSEAERPKTRSVPRAASTPEVVEEATPQVPQQRRTKTKKKTARASQSDTKLIKLLIGIGGTAIVVVVAIFGFRSLRKSNDMSAQGDNGSSPSLKNQNRSDNDGKRDPSTQQKENSFATAAETDFSSQHFEYAGNKPVSLRSTGFVVNASGLFLTTYSNIRNNSGKYFVAIGANAYPASVLRFSEKLDLAVLKLTGADNLPSLSFAAPAGKNSSSSLQTFGFQNDGKKCHSEKGLSGTMAGGNGKLDFTGQFGANAIGGPVINSNGLVVGVIGFRISGMTHRNVAIMIPAAEILDWAKGLDLKTALDSSGTPDTGESAILRSVGIALGRSSKKYQTFTENFHFNKANTEGIITGFTTESDEHNFLLIDEALQALADVKAGHVQRSMLSCLAKCQRCYRKLEVVSIAERYMAIRENRGPAMFVFARFADNAYDRLTSEFKFSRHGDFERALIMTADKRMVESAIQRLSMKHSMRDNKARAILMGIPEPSEEPLLNLYRKSSTASNRDIIELIELIGAIGGQKSIDELRKIAPVGYKRGSTSLGDYAESSIRQIESRLRNPHVHEIYWPPVDFESSFTIDFKSNNNSARGFDVQ